MGQISEKITVVDDFSDKLNRFCHLIEQSANSFEDAKEKFVDFVTKPLKGLGKLTDAWGKLKDAANAFADSRGVKALEDETRFRALYGDLVGTSAVNQYRQNANELSVDTDAYMKNALSMNRAGFGTDDVTQWGKLADKMALITGSAFEDVFSGLASDATGHSTSNMASLLGGGQGVEQMLKRAGVERMLNRGDLESAASAFEKIADKLGYSQDAAEIMGGTIKNQIEKTINKIDNKIKDIERFATKAIKPAFDSVMRIVNKIADSKLFNSALEGLKKNIAFVAKGFEAVSNVVESIVSAIVDFVDEHEEIFEFIGGVVVKTFGIVAAIKAIQLAVKGVSFAINIATKAAMLFTSVVGFVGIAIIAGLVFAAQAFQKFWEERTGESINFLQGLLGSVFWFSGVIVGTIQKIGDEIYNFGEWIKETILNAVDDMGLGFVILFNSIKDSFFDAIKNEIDSVVQKIADMLEFFGQAEKAASLHKIADDMKSALDDVSLSWNAGGRYEAKYREPQNIMDKANEYAKQGVILGGEISQALEDKFGPVFSGFTDVLTGIGRNTNLIRGMMAEAQEVAWLKELSERQYINKLNVQSPNVVQNVHVVNNHPSNNKDILSEIERGLIEQQEINGFGVGLRRGA